MKKNVKLLILLLLGVVVVALVSHQLTLNITDQYEFSPDNPVIKEGETQTFQAKLLLAPESLVYYVWVLDDEVVKMEYLTFEYSYYTTPALEVGVYSVKVEMVAGAGVIDIWTGTTLTVTEPSPTPSPPPSPSPNPEHFSVIMKSAVGGTTTPTAGTYAYSEGHSYSLTIQAHASSGYQFKYWLIWTYYADHTEGPNKVTTTPYTFSVSYDTVILPTFESLTPTPSPSPTIGPTPTPSASPTPIPTVPPTPTPSPPSPPSQPWVYIAITVVVVSVGAFALGIYARRKRR